MPPEFLKQMNYAVNLCEVKSKYFPSSLLGTCIRSSFVCSQLAGSTYIQMQDRQNSKKNCILSRSACFAAAMGMFPTSKQSSELSVDADLFHSFNSPKG